MRILQGIFSEEPPVYAKPTVKPPVPTSAGNVQSRPAGSVNVNPSSNAYNTPPQKPSPPRPFISSVSPDTLKRDALARALSEKIAAKSNDLANTLSSSVENLIQTHRELTENGTRIMETLGRVREDEVRIYKRAHSQRQNCKRIYKRFRSSTRN